jgi:hypothetical protein
MRWALKFSLPNVLFSYYAIINGHRDTCFPHTFLNVAFQEASHDQTFNDTVFHYRACGHPGYLGGRQRQNGTPASAHDEAQALRAIVHSRIK